jgi:hypothetical protein
MIGTMTIITTFITPYLLKIGWKLADYAGSSAGRFTIPFRKDRK